MIRTTRKDFWMRIALVGIMFMSVMPLTVIDGVSITITIPFAFFVGTLMVFGMLWFVRQLDPVIDGMIRICEVLCRMCFVYIEIGVADERTVWCKENILAFWFRFNGVYYFRRKVDAIGFKLTWI